MMVEAMRDGTAQRRLSQIYAWQEQLPEISTALTQDGASRYIPHRP